MDTGRTIQLYWVIKVLSGRVGGAFILLQERRTWNFFFFFYTAVHHELGINEKQLDMSRLVLDNPIAGLRSVSWL